MAATRAARRTQPALAAGAHARRIAPLAPLCALVGACINSTTGLDYVASQPGAWADASAFLPGTQSTDDNAPTSQPPPSPPPAAASLTVVGRLTRPDQADPDHFISAWPGTSVGVRFFGTDLVARMADTDRLPLPPPSVGWPGLANMWDVAVDGVVQPAFVVAGRQPAAVTLASDLTPGEHEIWLTRRTEAPRLGRVEFFGVSAPGGTLLAPPAPRSRLIEVLGTSVETGLHVGVAASDPNERQTPNCPFYPQGLNQNRAWPKVLAEAVGAELVNVSLEGAGLVLGFTNYAGTGIGLPGIYPRSDVFVPDPKWGGTAADVVMVVAGWSDAVLLDPNDAATAARLGAAYLALLAEVRAAQASALIYAVVRSGDGSAVPRATMAALIQRAVAQRQAAGDARVGLLDLPAWSSALSNCDDHPNWAQHQSLAAAARTRLGEDLGW